MLRRQPLVVEGVPGFVQDAEKGHAEAVFVIAGGDAHVPRTDTRGEGVGGGVQAAAGKIVAEALGRQPGEALLAVHREMPAHHLARGRRLLP